MMKTHRAVLLVGSLAFTHFLSSDCQGGERTSSHYGGGGQREAYYSDGKRPSVGAPSI